MKALQPQDFETDQSMADIDYNEIKSVKSTSSEEDALPVEKPDQIKLRTFNTRKRIKDKSGQNQALAIRKMEKNIN